MSRVNAFFTAVVALSGLSLGAALVHTQQNKEIANSEENCRDMIEKEQTGFRHFMAGQLYKKAYLASFDGDWGNAEAASECASLLETGNSHWNFEARDLIGE